MSAGRVLGLPKENFWWTGFFGTIRQTFGLKIDINSSKKNYEIDFNLKRKVNWLGWRLGWILFENCIL